MYAFLQNAVMCNDVGRIAGRKQATQVRPDLSDPFRKLPTGQLRQHHIGNEQMNLMGMGLGKLHRLSRSVGSQDSVAQPFEDGLTEMEKRLLILNQQDRLRAS